MTTVEQAREALLPHVADMWHPKVDALIAAVRAACGEKLATLREAVELYVAAHENAALSDTEKMWLAHFRDALDAKADPDAGLPTADDVLGILSEDRQP